MIIETTLEGLNTFINAAFSEKAIPHLKLVVEIKAPNPRVLVKVYPVGLPPEERMAYDAALTVLEGGGNKINAIKAVREVGDSINLSDLATLKGGKEFIERWFPLAGNQ